MLVAFGLRPKNYGTVVASLPSVKHKLFQIQRKKPWNALLSACALRALLRISLWASEEHSKMWGPDERHLPCPKPHIFGNAWATQVLYSMHQGILSLVN